MNITVLGCGRWGSFLSWYHGRRNQVLLWGRTGSRSYEVLERTRSNDYVSLPDSVRLTNDLGEALGFSDIVVISISAQELRSLCAQINAYPLSGKTLILCMKGLEIETGKRLTEVVRESIPQDVGVAVWVGPGHVQDFTSGIPNCMVVDSDDPVLTERLVETFHSDLIRLYKGHDLIGTEVGAAAKNVVGIAAGMLDGLNRSSLKGALMARGAREISRLMKVMGASELSAYGLCHLGDYEATLFSPHSHNRQYGENYIRGERFGRLAEGVSTTKALVRLGEQYGVDLPICKTVYSVLYEGKTPEDALRDLFARSAKGEFDT